MLWWPKEGVPAEAYGKQQQGQSHNENNVRSVFKILLKRNRGKKYAYQEKEEGEDN
jgi:hypothetical protein